MAQSNPAAGPVGALEASNLVIGGTNQAGLVVPGLSFFVGSDAGCGMVIGAARALPGTPTLSHTPLRRFVPSSF